MFDGLYSNIGGKIKSWAKAIFVVEAIAAIIGGIVIMVDGERVVGDSYPFIGLLLIILGPFVALVSTWVLYGFGELIEKTCEIEENTRGEKKKGKNSQQRSTTQPSTQESNPTRPNINQPTQPENNTDEPPQQTTSNSEIKPYEFEKRKDLTEMTIPEGTTGIGAFAFYGCWNLTSITIPNSVNIIKKSAFKFCSKLTSIIIPHGVKSINPYTFNGCSSLKSIVIPNTVTIICDSAFYMCSSLTDVYFTGTEEDWNNIAIDSGNFALTSATIHYNYKP